MVEGSSQRKYIVGIDESNNGQYPTVMVAVASTNPRDGTVREEVRKIRSHAELRAGLIKHDGRDFRYALIPQEYIQIFGRHKWAYEVASQLILPLKNGQDEMDIYLDGYHSNGRIKLLRKLVSEKTLIDPSKIHIKDVVKSKTNTGRSKTMYNTNTSIGFAHGMANWIFRNLNLEARIHEIDVVAPHEKFMQVVRKKRVHIAA
ncbi:MAG: hypothetical protein ABIE22_04355 [archaeon]